MAALVYCLCSAINELYQITVALKRCDYDWKKSIKFLEYKKRLQLFQRLCREEYLEYLLKKYPKTDTNSIQIAEDTFASTRYNLATKDTMQRAGIDFAAIEATAEACEAIDSFAIVDHPDYASNKDLLHDFMEVERIESGFRENYYFDPDIEIIDGMEEECTSLYEDGEDEAVYHNPKLGLLQEGVSFTLTGKTKRHCEKFSINFIIENANRDIALHINPRLPQNYIVRNTKLRGVWGREEVASALPFSLRRGQAFSMQVLFTDECFMISVNGYHFCKYFHRVPYKTVDCIEVKGEIDDVQVERKVVSHYPERDSIPKTIRLSDSLKPPAAHSEEETIVDIGGDEVQKQNLEQQLDQQLENWKENHVPNFNVTASKLKRTIELSLPFYGIIPKGFFEYGRVLKVEGRVKLLPQTFYINLQTGHNCWPHQTIALHLNPRFTKQSSGAIGRATVIRNSWVDGAWGQEEKSEVETSFRPGKNFSLSIVHGDGLFEIYVNHELITEYKFRVHPNTIDMIYIQGDIKLFDVVLENNASIEQLRTNNAEMIEY